MENLGSAPGRKGLPAQSFGSFRLEPDGTLLRGELPVQLEAGELKALRLLLERQGKIVTHAELRQAFGLPPQAGTQAVAARVDGLRHRLEPDEHIQSVPRRGFRFASEVREHSTSEIVGLPRLAILPLAVEYGAAEYLGAAVTEGATDRLSRRRPAVCTLAAKESVATLARSGLSPLEIGRAMHADIVLTGSLRPLPAHHRMRIELIELEHGKTLWTEDLLVERSNLAGLETELARLVIWRLEGGQIAISASIEQHTGDREPRNREAWDLYQRARYEWQSLERHRMQDAVQHLTRASELDPSLTAARVDLAHLAITEAFHGYLAPSVAVGIVRRAAKPGFEPGAGGEAILPALGWVSFHYDRDLRAALNAFQRSAHLPHDPWVSRARVMLAISRHRFDEAQALMRDALLVDPFSPWLHARIAWTSHLMGDAARSVREVESALQRFPGHEGVELYAGIILAFNGQAERAAELAGALAQRRPYLDPASATHAYTLAAAGKSAQAHSILERMEWLGHERYVLNSLSAAAYTTLGQHDQAIAELVAANDARCPWLFQALADPRLAPLHKEPQFIALNRILPEMEQAAG